jgi:type IV secretion system protein VirD4
MKKKIIITSVIFTIQFMIFPTVALSVRRIVDTFNFNFLTPEYALDKATSFSTYITYVTKLDPYNVGFWGVMFFTVLATLFDFFGSGVKDKRSYKQMEGYGSHGTARWQTDKEIKSNYYQDDIGWFLGHLEPDVYTKESMEKKYAVLATNGELNSQVNVIGAPGSKKTTGFIYGNLFHLPAAYKKANLMADLIITDPKSELHAQTASYLEGIGYDVHVLDFIHLKHGDALNSMEFITEEKELMEIAEGYISAATSAKKKGNSGGSSDPIWENGEALLLAALIGFVKQKYPPEQQTFYTVGEVLTSRDIRDPDTAEFFFRNNNITGAPLHLYKKFLLLEDKVRSGVLGGLGINLTLFSIDGIQKITSKTTIDIRKLGAKKDKPIALFIFMPDGDKTFSPVINTAITTILNTMYKTAYEYGNKLYTPVYMLLDEIANIGRMNALVDKLGTMRGRRIYPMMIWQSLSQMKERYGDAMGDITGNCDTAIYLGVNDNFTADEASKAVGITTIRVQGTSNSPTSSSMLASDKKSESFSYQKRELLLPDEVRRYPNELFFMTQRGRNPVQLYKIQYEYWKPESKICKETNYKELPLLVHDMETVDSKMEPETQNEKVEHSTVIPIVAASVIAEEENESNLILDNLELIGENEQLEQQPIEGSDDEKIEDESDFFLPNSSLMEDGEDDFDFDTLDELEEALK